MRKQGEKGNCKIWLSAQDTYNWAHKAEASWPCSELSNKRVFAEFSRGDLVDFAINGKICPGDCDITEFNAIMSDFGAI